MKSFFIISFILFGFSGIISQHINKRRTIILQHPDIPQQFHVRRTHTGAKFSKQQISKKVCRFALLGDIFEAVQRNTSLMRTPAHFPAKYNVELLTNVEIQTLTFKREGTDIQIEVIKCTEYNGKTLYVENATDVTNFYIFESTSSTNDTPLIRRAMKIPDVLWNIRVIVKQAEQVGVQSLTQHMYDELRVCEKDFQSNYTAVGPRLWKNICSIKGFKRFELCSLLHPFVNPLSHTYMNMVNRMREEASTCGPASARIHIQSTDPIGRSGFLPVEVIGCYVNNESREGVKPNFYVAADHRENGRAFLLTKSPLPLVNHLIVKLHLTNVSTLIDLV